MGDIKYFSYLLLSFRRDQLILKSNFAYFSMLTYERKFEKINLTFQFIQDEIIEIPYHFESLIQKTVS